MKPIGCVKNKRNIKSRAGWGDNAGRTRSKVPKGTKGIRLPPSPGLPSSHLLFPPFSTPISLTTPQSRPPLSPPPSQSLTYQFLIHSLRLLLAQPLSLSLSPSACFPSPPPLPPTTRRPHVSTGRHDFKLSPPPTRLRHRQRCYPRRFQRYNPPHRPGRLPLPRMA